MKEGRKRAKRAAQNLLRRAKRSTSNSALIHRFAMCAPCGAKSKAKTTTGATAKHGNLPPPRTGDKAQRRTFVRCCCCLSPWRCVEDPRTGLRHDFSRKGGVSGSLTLAPDNAPAWASDPAQLWANVETIEKRKDAQLCREFDIALPRELTPSSVPRWPVRSSKKSSLTGACVQRLLSITSVETTPFPPDDHDARH